MKDDGRRRCMTMAPLPASLRRSRVARARISGSCHQPTSPSGDLGTKSRVACILRSTWSSMLHIGPRSAPRRSAPRVMHTRLSRLLVLLIVALATVLCTSHRVSTLRATLRLQVRASYNPSGSRHYTSALSHIRHVCARGFRIDWVRLAPKHPTSPSASFCTSTCTCTCMTSM